jgi:hypothetical protein
MAKQPKKAAPKPNTPRQQALSREQKVPEAKAPRLLEALHASGIDAPEVAGILLAQAAAVPAMQNRTAGEQMQTAIDTLGQIKPEGALQSMLAVQMIGVHNSAVRFLMRASEEGQTFEVTDANVHRAVRLHRVFIDQLQALASLRGQTGQQKVTVEHVHVYEGGQAIVGSIDVPRGEGNGN